MRQQNADHPGMGDDDRLRHRQSGHEIERPALQLARRFAARRGIAGDIGRPGIEFGARNIVPAPALPAAEIHFEQPIVEARLAAQLLRQHPATAQRTAPHRQAGRQFAKQAAGDRRRIFGRNIQPAIADARLDRRFRVTDQVQDHSE